MRGDSGTSDDISIHAPPRGATLRSGAVVDVQQFQFTPLREGRLAGQTLSESHKNFNSRPSARGDTGKQRRARAATTFQFTPLREGRLCARRKARNSSIFQFTPLREGRPRWEARWESHRHISIHAPPRGATGPLPADSLILSFQFTPLREGRRQRPPRPALAIPFQFTPLREGRHPGGASRHAQANFNSRPSARGDGKRYAISANLLFNPYKSAWLNNSATQFVEIILVIFHRIIA